MEKKTVRMVCFTPKLRPQLELHREKKIAATLIGCSIKEAQNDFELLASDRTTVEASGKKFSLPSNLKEIDSSAPVYVKSVDDVEKTAINQHITVIGKVVAVESAVNTPSRNRPDGLMKKSAELQMVPVPAVLFCGRTE